MRRKGKTRGQRKVEEEERRPLKRSIPRWLNALPRALGIRTTRCSPLFEREIRVPTQVRTRHARSTLSAARFREELDFVIRKRKSFSPGERVKSEEMFPPSARLLSGHFALKILFARCTRTYIYIYIYNLLLSPRRLSRTKFARVRAFKADSRY